MDLLQIDGRSHPFSQLKMGIGQIDLLAWLAAQPTYPKVYWKDRDTQIARAAVGNLLSFPYLPSLAQNNPDIRLYGGMQFAKKTHFDETWQTFPESCFWLPQIEVSENNGQAEAVFYSFNEKPSQEALVPVDFNPPPLSAQKYDLLERKETPDFDAWQQGVTSALSAITIGTLSKLVLARRSSLYFSKPLSPWHLLSHLKEKAKAATLFAFQLSPTLCFLGATPEKLFSRDNDLLTTDAVAGTRPRGKSAEEEVRLEQELLFDSKEQREFKVVREYLERSLSALSQEIRWEGNDRIVKASHVQHLYNRLHTKLKSGVSDAQLVRALHPTPALGGFPREKSLALLNQLEPFARGWYGSPIGVLSPRGASLYVGIRSALIRGRALHLFAGTGLVQGSDPEKEWEELEHKIRPFTELFI
ncbi:MAG: isochorismate synthase [Candidatus Melainabacteria bacterium]|nr:isochorismate synthase [Candidatus Melainabacteria bacterium]